MITTFDIWLSDEIWMLLKGRPIPKSYSDIDRTKIIERYWSRAVELERTAYPEYSDIK